MKQDLKDKEAKNIADLVAENIRQLNEETSQSSIIKTGFDEFDAKFGGFRLSEFIIIGGRPAMGKTQLLINLTLNISTTIPVLYISLELSEFSLTSRFISSISEISINKILQNDLNEKQKKKLSAIGNEFTKRQIFISDCSNSDILALKAHCLKQICENGIKVIIIDFMQLMTSYDYRSYREQEVSFICRELRKMAKEHNVCVIVSSQLNRGCERRYIDHKRPDLIDLRDSGAMEEDADKVIFIYRPEYYGIISDGDGYNLINLAEIIVAKNRNGSLGVFNLTKDDDFTNFRNCNSNELRETPF